MKISQWRWREWIWLTGPSRLERNLPHGINMSSIRVFDQMRDLKFTITLRSRWLFSIILFDEGCVSMSRSISAMIRPWRTWRLAGAGGTKRSGNVADGWFWMIMRAKWYPGMNVAYISWHCVTFEEKPRKLHCPRIEPLGEKKLYYSTATEIVVNSTESSK